MRLCARLRDFLQDGKGVAQISHCIAMVSNSIIMRALATLLQSVACDDYTQPPLGNTPPI